MTPGLLATIYCLPIVVACLTGGALPRLFKLNHTRMQQAISFVAGLILGVGLLHLIPHAAHELNGSIDATVGWAMLGFLAMFIIARFLHFHHHDAPTESDEPPSDDALAHSEVSDHEHDHDHVHDACTHHPHHAEAQGLHVHAGAWIGTAVGMTLHSLLDGVALAAAIRIESEAFGVQKLAGLGVFLAVLLHKPFDSLTISMLMSSAHASPARRRLINLLYAAIVPIGVAGYFFTVGQLSGDTHQVIGATLAIAGGVFLCISTSDLLPELQFHTHDRSKLTAALLLGVALAYGIGFLESSGHDSHADPEPVSEQVQPADAEN